MKPDRSNYEIWLIDWLDGKLSEHQIGQLQEFLDINPDLREEAVSFPFSHLSPDDKPFPEKNLLRRTPSELHYSQFEYLAVAYLENDLSPDQLTELNESIEHNEEKRRVFNSIQKLKLTPPRLRYNYKGRLLQKTAGARIIRMSLMGLSAAAMIALIILSYIFVPRYIAGKNDKAAFNISSDSALRQPDEMIIYKSVALSEKPFPAGDRQEISVRSVAEPVSDETTGNHIALAAGDSSVLTREMPDITISKVAVFSKIDLNLAKPEYTLIASNNTYTEPPYEYDDGRSRLSKFIARTFREKILKTETYNESPLKSYEIAEAGIKGLNMLFGFEMALQKTYDETGELKSIYFSSKILKFNAPVKKTTLVP
ncbi:MAG: hypothetical protein MUO72_10525 [Bacteroidales bacterium]|nr:hypothetical protein [Bacteroidales bacterium]